MAPEDNARVVILTGAAGGIGLAVAARLAAEGYGLVLVDREPSAETPKGAVVLTGDVRDARLVGAALDAAAGLGQLHGLVNLAAIRHYRAFLDVEAAFAAEHFEVNVMAPLRWMQEFARRVEAAGGQGAIVNVTSVMAHRVAAHNAIYAASKTALWSLSCGAALDLARSGVRVNCVAPGPTRTPMLADLLADQEKDAAIKARVPLGRAAEPDEITGAVAFLLSADSLFMTGSTVTVDGGYLLV